MGENMDDGEKQISDHNLHFTSEVSNSIQASESTERYLDELLRNSRTCTHTHPCNPTAPEDTHTCFHTHTQLIPSSDKKIDGVPTDGEGSDQRPRRPNGNREAVRKYREKKKAQTAHLEDEVKKLRFLNQQLVKRVERQGALEKEILRLRGFLHDLRGKIDAEFGGT